MDPAPGYDPRLPHDMAHFVVENELGITGGVFGQLAQGGVCSTTPVEQWVHLVHDLPYGSQPPVGACQTLDNPFGARYMFWFAEPIRNNDLKLPPSANGLSNTPDDFCVSNWLSPRGAPSFTYEDENVSLKACESPDKDPIPVWITPHSVDTWIDPNVSFTRQ
jgi:hypothetical protein